MDSALTGATGASVSEFHRRWYRPENAVIIVVGDLPPAAMEAAITKWFSEWQGQGPREPEPPFGDPLTPKGAKGLLCLPYFSGERTPIHDPHARGVFFGLNLTHDRADMFRAVVEGEGPTKPAARVPMKRVNPRPLGQRPQGDRKPQQAHGAGGQGRPGGNGGGGDRRQPGSGGRPGGNGGGGNRGRGRPGGGGGGGRPRAASV